ncbi:MAG: 1,4-alpha-glucan branching protein domain-containing protein [Tepidisphaeraceae bacterium]|jgi:1,4-alpha-glucan branching enzyme
MSHSLGSLCIVLHGHLPYVLHHGSYPHGEAWLYEAATETYLPLLDLIGQCALLKARPAITIGLTPVLLEQLAHEDFKTGLEAYLKHRMARASDDQREFEKSGQAHQAHLARWWQSWYADRLEHFHRIGRDIPREFAQRVSEGHIQVLTSSVTHAYLPLVLTDQSIRAQIAAGTAVTRRRLGIEARGLWLPECAYRPHWDHWLPSVLYGDARDRPGLETFMADAGITHFFVDTDLITQSEAMGTFDGGRFQSVAPAQVHWDTQRGWREVLEPVGVVSEPQAPRCFALGRHPGVSEQVWSGSVGYPGNSVYLEFHKKHGHRGLRYWKVTDNKSDLGKKDLYQPDDVAGKIHEHATHFCSVVRQVLQEYHQRTGRRGVCVAPFDAELFGHWWFEGPRFLRDVILTMSHEASVSLSTAQEALDRHPPDKVVRLPEGSWGEKGNHSVWMNDKTRWMWEVEYRAERSMVEMVRQLPWKSDYSVAEHLRRAGRQLLLLQASDWPFVVHTSGAVDYGIQRFSGHATNFERASQIAQQCAAAAALSDLQRIEMQDMDAHDSVLDEIDLNWWT